MLYSYEVQAWINANAEAIRELNLRDQADDGVSLEQVRTYSDLAKEDRRDYRRKCGSY